MSNNDISKTTPAAKLKQLTHKSLGDKVPRRGGSISPPIARRLFKLLGWKAVGEIPNVPKAVLLALPHTSNFDGLYAIPLILGLDLDINIMGKDSLFKYPILARFFKWAGIIPINRSKRGTVLQASIDRLKSSESLYLGLAPEGTRDYTDKWKTGFYYIADGAQVPIIPVAMDYKTKEIRFLNPVYTTGDYDKDVMKIVEQYKGVVPKYPEKMSKPLKDINK
ncbi:lysophospholipid acyltransferase family protein [Psychrobacter piechaudii]|uniref:2-acyl-glycerophospho-ethanolamine acyltransferase n=1 Tax=Psychrobacter piechaudii TaxID=1945521 RepID=A0A1R4GXZ6_9GAMM|nr:lysophospholipid acyltransferase family protein [Psychrobacter piechaudii]SJM73031.1 2-acyl-glycerophospho-ethanolamine acyltransferase [Psychrobacter piechaudii]